MQKKRRELFIKEKVKEQVDELHQTKFIKLGDRWHLCTVILLWITVFGYLVATGSCILYLIS